MRTTGSIRGGQANETFCKEQIFRQFLAFFKERYKRFL